MNSVSDLKYGDKIKIINSPRIKPFPFTVAGTVVRPPRKDDLDSPSIWVLQEGRNDPTPVGIDFEFVYADEAYNHLEQETVECIKGYLHELNSPKCSKTARLSVTGALTGMLRALTYESIISYEQANKIIEQIK